MLKSVVFAIEIPRLSPFRALHSARSSNVGELVLVIKTENNKKKDASFIPPYLTFVIPNVCLLLSF